MFKFPFFPRFNPPLQILCSQGSTFRRNATRPLWPRVRTQRAAHGGAQSAVMLKLKSRVGQLGYAMGERVLLYS